MSRTFSTAVLDTLLKTVEVEFKVPLLGFGEIKFPVSEHAKEWWKNEKAREDLQNAIEAAEQKFITQHKDNKAAQLLREFSLKNEKEFQRIIVELLNHLDEQKITLLMADRLGKGFEKIVSNKELQDALNDYLPYLRDELSKIKEFREVITYFLQKQIANTTTLTYATTQEIKDLLMEQRTPKAEIQTTFTPEILADIDILPEPSDFLPPGSRMPFYRNKIFTGRETDLIELAKVLLASYESSKNIIVTQIAAASGMGGIGKTQLAVEFCYRYGKYFRGIHWINARDGNLESEIAACGLEMGLPNFPKTTPEQVFVTLQTWKTQPLRLIVLDNLVDPTLLSEWLPRLNGLHLLITARRQQYPPDLGIEVRQLGTLPRVDSLALLRRLSPRLIQTPNAEIEPLAEHLGDLPLALDLAGRYLAVRRSLSVDEYLKQLDQQGSALNHSSLKNWAKDASPTAHETNLAATFLLSWKQLGNSIIDKLAKKFFIVSGYLAANVPISHDVFLYFSVSKETWDNARDTIGYVDFAKIDFSKYDDAVDDSLLRLQELGLINETFALHPLLAEFAITQENDNKNLIALANIMAILSTKLNDSGIPKDFLPLLPHMESISQHAEHAEIEDAGVLWNNLGYHYNHVGQYITARIAFEHALKIDEKVFGANYRHLSIRYSNLGGILETLGDFDGAKKYYERGLELDEKNYGRDHPKTAGSLSNLAYLYECTGDLQKSRSLHKRALEIVEKAYGKEHPTIAGYINNLGLILWEMGDLPNAKDAMERALAIDEKTYNSEHPDIARDLLNLGLILNSLGNLHEAKARFERALAIDENVYGKEHPSVARDLHELAALLTKMNDYSLALDFAQRALKIKLKFLPSEHQSVKNTRWWVNEIERKLQERENKD